MHRFGEGVTRNFLTILETEARRTGKSAVRLLIVAALVTLVGYLLMQALPGFGYVAIPALAGAAFLLGVAVTRVFTLDAYEVSLRDNWNRWMRWSVNCRSVQECYARVHDKEPRRRRALLIALSTLLLLAHLVLLVFILNGAAKVPQILPVLGLDAILIGFVAGRRIVLRRWYRGFIRACNELLREGHLGLWGVF